MKNALVLLVFSVFQFSQPLFGQAFPEIIIKDVNIIPVTKDTVLLKKSVAILNGKIVDINEFQKLKKNSKTKIINGADQFLMPGLTEMHIHLPDPEKLDTFLTTMVAAGVTHVRVMFSPSPIAEQRKLIATKTIKPRVYYPYLLTKNNPARSEKQMDSLFSKIIEDKYDFAKLYDFQYRTDFNDTVFDRLMSAANKNNVIVCGHYPANVRLSKVLNSGFKSIEHLGGYTSIPEDKIELAMELTKKNGVYNCPTLDWDVMSYDLPFPDGYHKRLIMDNAPKHYIDTWNSGLEDVFKRVGKEKIASDKNAYMPTFDKKLRLLKRLNETGNLLILGGENGNLFQLEGFNMFEEMVIWSKAGISNFDILKASVYNPAKFFNEEQVRGTVEKGKEASLIILNKNPLLNIENIKTIHTTIINGNIFYKADLLKQI